MKKLLILLALTSSLYAAALDYTYHVKDVAETKKGGTIISVHVVLAIDKTGVDSLLYDAELSDAQLALYIADAATNFPKICEDIAVLGRKALDVKIAFLATQPTKVLYDKPALDAIAIDPVKVEAKQ